MKIYFLPLDAKASSYKNPGTKAHYQSHFVNFLLKQTFIGCIFRRVDHDLLTPQSDENELYSMIRDVIEVDFVFGIANPKESWTRNLQMHRKLLPH